MSIDLLLLNATNYAPYPVYPYAFVQLRALGARHGLVVEGRDLFGIPPARRSAFLRRVLDRLRPRAVGVHVRQADSLLLRDYHPATRTLRYFPLNDTAAVVAEVRSRCDVPLVAGGFGFTTHASRLFRSLGVDLGVAGEPDALFATFDDALASRGLDRIDNLLFSRGDTVVRNDRVFAPPLDEREYDDAVFDELERFYGRDRLFGEDPPTVAVELSRGCPYRCYFCTEPTVKGRRNRVRDLDAVMADVEFLAGRGARRIWLVCSELNIGSADLAQRVAERFLHLNERLPEPVCWRAYALPRWLDRETLGLLYRSGFAGGWNDFPALDDPTLTATRVPYRSNDLVAHARATAELAPGGPDGRGAKIGLFLGNAFATPRSIATTLRRFDDDLVGLFPRAEVGTATRVFESGAEILGEQAVSGATTYGVDGPRPSVDLSQPTFFIPKAILDVLGGHEDALGFFGYVEHTLLARRHRRNREWARFLRGSASVEWLLQRLQPTLVAKLPGGLPAAVDTRLRSIFAEADADRATRLQELLDPDQHDREIANVAALVLCEALRSIRCPRFETGMRELGIDVDPAGRARTTPYRLLRAVVSRYDSEAQLVAGISAEQTGDVSLSAWRVRRLAYEHDLRIDPRFRPFLVEAA